MAFKEHHENADRHGHARTKPRKYAREAQAQPAAPQPTPGQGLWTCPVHPQIIRNGPGNCPICGMALEPMTATGAERENPELVSMTRRFWVSVVLSAPLLLLVMAQDLLGMPVSRLLSANGFMALQLLLATPVVLWGGWPFFERG
jgi:Cu+-exporting ATPase